MSTSLHSLVDCPSFYIYIYITELTHKNALKLSLQVHLGKVDENIFLEYLVFTVDTFLEYYFKFLQNENIYSIFIKTSKVNNLFQ